MSAPPVTIVDSSDPKPAASSGKHPRERKQHYSAWLITVNTNKPVNDPHSDDAQKQLQAFRTCMDALFRGIGQFVKIRSHDQTDKFNKRCIDSVHVQKGAFEVGRQQHRLHFHAYVKIAHRTVLQLDLQKIRAFLRERMGFTCQLQAVFVPASDDQKIADYIAKYSGAQ